MPEVRKVQITGLTRSPETGSLVYALDTGAIGGLFAYDLQENFESRLFHRQEFRANDLAHHPSKQLVALSLPNDDGTAGIALMQPGGHGLRPITEGDVRDETPSWVPTPENIAREVLVYQSSGIARNERGHVTGRGPYSISRLDIDSVKQTTVIEDSKFDFLVPRVRIEDGKEVLYFIRRPYKPDGNGAYTPLKLLLDILLFPLRLIRAIFGFLNFFSIMFAQKPLTTAGGPKAEKMDTRYLMLHGKWIDAEKALKAANKGQPAALVPASWELFRMSPNGTLDSLATAVLSFDIAPDGTIIHTNGAEIFTLSQGEKPERICTHRMIQQVMAVS